MNSSDMNDNDQNKTENKSWNRLHKKESFLKNLIFTIQTANRKSTIIIKKNSKLSKTKKVQPLDITYLIGEIKP